MTWSACPFWPGCGAHVEGGCGDCDPEIDEREEAYWENLSEDEWEDYADEDERDDPEPLGKVMARRAQRVDSGTAQVYTSSTIAGDQPL